MERYNRQVFDQMTIHLQLKRILTLGILLPVFLLGLNIFGSVHTDQPGIHPIIFALKPEQNEQALFERYGISGVAGVFERHNELAQTYRGQVKGSILSLLRSDPGVLYAEADTEVRASAITVNDPYFTTDYQLDEKQWYLPKIKIPEAWEFSRGSNSVVVAVIDTGIHASHIELNDGRIIEGYDTVTNQNIPANSNSDDNGHGTAVAGVIAAIPNNGRGITGIDHNIRLMPVKALNADGTGDISAVAAAIVWAADHGAHIINLSLGGPGFGADQTLNNAISYAHNRGLLIVAAAGNDLSDQGINLDTSPVYPICSDLGSNMILGVAASDVNDRKASFSNFGINCVDITAPGKKILTTAFLPSDPANNILIYGSGTSLATPIVTGVAALLKSNNLNLTNVELRTTLLRSVDNIDSLNQDNCLGSSCNGFLGKGRINALKALSPIPITDGSLIRESQTGKIYWITGGIKRFVSNFVFQQRGFSTDNIVNEVNSQLAGFVVGPSLPPLDETLIKSPNDATVYVINQELKRPLTYLVFVSRNYSFANVHTLSDSEMADISTGDWYWPPDQTMVLIIGNPTVYVMDKGVRRAVTYFVFIQRKLSFAKVIKVTPDEFSHVPAPADPYWLPPLDGTLVKSSTGSEVYVLENGTRRALSYNAFIARKYSFRNIKTLPQAEIDVIAPGSPIL